MEELSKLKISCSRVNAIDQVFEGPARRMTMEMTYPLGGADLLRLIASPIKLSETPVSYRHAPPSIVQHTDEVLSEILDSMRQREINSRPTALSNKEHP